MRTRKKKVSDGSRGWGMQVSDGAQVSFTRGLVSGNRDVGVVVAVNAGTIATFEDVVIEDTQEEASDGSGGRGMQFKKVLESASREALCPAIGMWGCFCALCWRRRHL